METKGEFQTAFVCPWRALREGDAFLVQRAAECLHEGLFCIRQACAQWSVQDSNFSMSMITGSWVACPRGSCPGILNPKESAVLQSDGHSYCDGLHQCYSATILKLTSLPYQLLKWCKNGWEIGIDFVHFYRFVYNIYPLNFSPFPLFGFKYLFICFGA